VTAHPFDTYRPSYVRKSYPREPFPVHGEKGAWQLLKNFGLPLHYGEPSKAAAFRDMTGWVRCICAFFPKVGYSINLHINKHVSHIAKGCRIVTFPNARVAAEHAAVIYNMRCRSENYRGEDL
jgi:hypothetical protein